MKHTGPQDHTPTTAEADADAPLTTSQIVQWFARAQRAEEAPLVGTELECFAVRWPGEASSSAPSPVDYEHDIARLLDLLVREFSWNVGADRGDGGEVVHLERDSASITLEPGGQVELSGAPLANAIETMAELQRHQAELTWAGERLGLKFFVAGHHPFATREEINWMPKGRYAIMRGYLPQRGRLALDMMSRTCTVQVNLDYSSQTQCGQRLRLATAISPILTAIFANSPYREGRDTGLASARSNVWSDVDPDRCGLLDLALQPGDFEYARYVDWAINVPMFFVKRGGEYHAHHARFSQFMRDGFVAPDGTRHRATLSDWVLHASTLFPEVRLKPFIELRGCDGNPIEISAALPALARGLFYDADSCSRALELAPSDIVSARELWTEARRHGLSHPVVGELADKLVQLADEGLSRLHTDSKSEQAERRLLDPIRDLTRRRCSPSSELSAKLGPSPGRDAEARRAFIHAMPLSRKSDSSG